MKRQHLFYALLMLFTALSTHAKEAAADFAFKVTVHGQGQPMLLIPGLSNDMTVWDSTVIKFQDRYEMHTVTLPGFAGQPAMSEEGPFLTRVRDQLQAYVQQQGWQKPVLVGHSLGGYMALLLAIEQPDFYDKIIIVDSVPFMPALTMPMATEESAKLIAENMKKQMDAQTKDMQSTSLDMILATMITDPEHIKLAKQWGMDSDSATVSQAMYELMTQDIRQEIAVIQSPTLVMASYVAYKPFGVTRELLAQNYGAQYEQLQGHQLAITDTGKHFIMWDDPEFYFAKMGAFLAQ
ncbi:alpha/beta fold hydrolase [Marinicella meishanensis]|uniref:alpha/beta fold hydrolase n=1 Tax=Marinicella meishanensis TaxID=2873263 RepID=UPI001CBF5A89|nr:alpha/beta hydrolase [Marinicella sp. NBU2979]